MIVLDTNNKLDRAKINLLADLAQQMNEKIMDFTLLIDTLNIDVDDDRYSDTEIERVVKIYAKKLKELRVNDSDKFEIAYEDFNEILAGHDIDIDYSDYIYS